MKFFLSLVLCALGLVPCLSAQTPHPVYKDPNHRQVLYTNFLRVLDVNFAPGETGLEHQHDRDVATVAIQNGRTRVRLPGQDWGPPRDRAIGNVNATQYAGMPGAHTIQNIDTVPYRLIAVVNERESGWTMPALLKAPGTTLNQQTRAFALYDVRLDAATPETTHTHQVSTITVLIAGVIENQGGGGEMPFRMSEPGRWQITQVGQTHTLSVPPGATAHAVEFEVR